MRVGKGLAVASLVVAVVLSVVLMRSGTPPSRPPAPGRDGGPPPMLQVYCAAGVKAPVVALVEQFTAEYGIEVNMHYGGSGTLLSNLQVARQGDLYLAGDASYVELARDKGLVAEILPLAHMVPVIAVPAENPASVNGIDDLLQPGVRLALGNPDAAAIGKAAARALAHHGVWDAAREQVSKHGVFKPTVPEIANDVKIGAVDAGIVWDATVAQYPELGAVRDPVFASQTQEISIGVLNSSSQAAAALRLARYLNSTVGNDVFERHGYRPVDGDVWAWQPEITFFCGSVNRRAIEEVLNEFQRREGVTINTVYNGCGILTAQMRTIRQGDGGAGFPDTYMACDRYYLENVAEWFQDDVDVSRAAIVVAVQKGNPLGISTLQDLAKPGVRIAVGQPEQCTIGALTRIMLEKEGLLDAVMANVVTQAASSAQLVPAVTTKSVDAALAYSTDTLAEADKVDTVTIDSVNARATQPFSIARSSQHKHLGRRLLAHIHRSRERFESAGFEYLLDDTDGGPTP